MKYYLALNKMPLCIFWFGLLLLGSNLAQASGSLYTADVAVVSRSSEDRKKVLPQALRQVFIKVSGHSSVASLPALKRLMLNAENYVQSYGYTERNGLRLQVHFNANVIQQLLNENRQAIWSDDRPAILIWSLIKGNEINLLNADSGNSQLTQLQEAANQRGIPLIFPLLDLQDLATVSNYDIEQLDQNRLQQASARYQSQVVLAGTATQEGANSWQGRWLLLWQGEAIYLNTQAKAAVDAIVMALNKVVDILSARFALLHSIDNNQQLFEVVGIDSMEKYIKVFNYLRGLEAVQKVSVSRIQSDSVVFGINLSGTQPAFIKAVRLGHVLKPFSGNTQADSSILRYHLEP